MDEVVSTELVPTEVRALHSDPHDFAGLYIRHRSSFTSHARRYLRDQRDAEEVVQEAFLRLFLALPELDTELQALAYCRRTITNLCIDRFRAQARRPYLVHLDSVAVDTLADDDPGDPVVRAEDAALVRAALSMLSPLHRAALVKREIEEKPLPVIAAELDIPEDSVKHLLFRARRALRRILTESSLGPGGTGQLSEALAKAVSKSGLAVVAIMLAAIGLGTGPDLRALPVVGHDLTDLPNIGQLMTSIGAAITGQPPAGLGAQGGGGDVASEPLTVGGDDSRVLVPGPSPSSSRSAPAAATAPDSPWPAAPDSASPSPGPATSTAAIDPTPSPESEPSPEPAPDPKPVPDPGPSAPPSSPAPSPTTQPPFPPPTTDPHPHPHPEPTASGSADRPASSQQGRPGAFASLQESGRSGSADLSDERGGPVEPPR